MLSNPKDKIENGKQNNIVYKIPCADCNAVCIGESKRPFDQRSKEHVPALSKTVMLIKTKLPTIVGS